MLKVKSGDKALNHIENFKLNLPETYSMEEIMNHIINFYSSQGFKFNKDFEDFKKDGFLIFKDNKRLAILASLTDIVTDKGNRLLVTVDPVNCRGAEVRNKYFLH